jgi:hypothetical protein
MKVLQLAALFRVAVSAVDPLVAYNGKYSLAIFWFRCGLLNGRRYCSTDLSLRQCTSSNILTGVRRDIAATTTQVVFVTSVNVETSLCLNAPDCPAGTTIFVTSTTVVASTTTICSTPGAVLPPLGASSSAAASIGSQSSGFSVSIIPGSSVESTVSVVPPTSSGSMYLPPVASSVVTSGFSDVPVSSGQPSKSNTDAIHVSFPSAPPLPGVSASSGTFTYSQSSPAGQSYGSSVSISASPSAGPSRPAGSSFAISSAYGGPSGTGSSASASSAADFPTFSAPSSYVRPYSSSALDTISTTRQGPPGIPASGSTTASRPTLRSTTSDIYGPPTLPAESESPVNNTVRVTSYVTKTSTSVVTPAPVSSFPKSTYPVSTDIEATDISRGTSASAYPSGSG